MLCPQLKHGTAVVVNDSNVRSEVEERKVIRQISQDWSGKNRGPNSGATCGA